MYRGVYGLEQVSAPEKRDLLAEATQLAEKRKPKQVKRWATDWTNMFLSGAVYSVQAKGRVIDHVRTLSLRDVVFETRPDRIAYIRRTGKKTVCCVMKGEWGGKLKPKEQKMFDKWLDPAGKRQLEKSGWRRVSFNPQRDETFRVVGDGNPYPIFTARQVIAMTDFYSPIGRPPALILARGINYTDKGWKRELSKTKKIRGVRSTRRNPKEKWILYFFPPQKDDPGGDISEAFHKVFDSEVELLHFIRDKELWDCPPGTRLRYMPFSGDKPSLLAVREAGNSLPCTDPGGSVTYHDAPGESVEVYSGADLQVKSAIRKAEKKAALTQKYELNPRNVQALLFDRKKWTVPRAKKWINKNGYKHPKLHTTKNYLRFRQTDPGEFAKGSFRTIDFGDGIKAVVATRRNGSRKNPNPVAGLKVELVPPKRVKLKGFSRAKVAKINKLLVPSLEAIERMADHALVFPSPIYPMTREEIAEGQKTVDAGHPEGAGHGLFYPDFHIVKVNAQMSWQNILANVIHENLHFVFPGATEHDVDDMTAEITSEILGYANNGSPPL
jgi:hypothetical protein